MIIYESYMKMYYSGYDNKYSRRFFTFSRNFKPINVALYGNCFVFNTNYNEGRDRLGGRRVSSLTGPSFGLNLIVKLDQINYMKGGITKQVEFYEEYNERKSNTKNFSWCLIQ